MMMWWVITTVYASECPNCTQGDCENGFGVCLLTGRSKYEGQWQNGQKTHGKQWSLVEQTVWEWYDGDFWNEQFHGQGTLRWRNGDQYVGEWKALPGGPGKRDGRGRMQYADGRVEEGLWRQGKYQGLASSPPEVPSVSANKLPLRNGQPVTSSSPGKRIALVIGNAAYSGIKGLKNPVNDAKVMAKTLQGLGFEVLGGGYVDLSQKEMIRVIRGFGETIAADKSTVGWFYFAGHGIQLNGENYLIPVDAQIEKEQDVELESVGLARVMAEMDNAQNRLNLVILDACRNNPFLQTFKRAWASKSGLAMVGKAPAGTLIAFATDPGAVAADGTGSNGLYTGVLVKMMKQPCLTLEQMFKRVRTEVKQLSEGQQVPWETTSLEGEDLYLAGCH